MWMLKWKVCIVIAHICTTFIRYENCEKDVLLVSKIAITFISRLFFLECGVGANKYKMIEYSMVNEKLASNMYEIWIYNYFTDKLSRNFGSSFFSTINIQCIFDWKICICIWISDLNFNLKCCMTLNLNLKHSKDCNQTFFVC